MLPEEFVGLLQHPLQVKQWDTFDLDGLAKAYPYSGALQAAYALKLYLDDHPGYQVQLRKAACTSGNRIALRNFIEGSRRMNDVRDEETSVDSIPAPAMETVANPPGYESPESDESLPVPEDFGAVSQAELDTLPAFETEVGEGESMVWDFSRAPIRRHPAVVLPPVPHTEKLTPEELLAIVKQRLAEICIPANPGEEVPQTSTGDREQHAGPPEQPMSKQALIDKFIREEPRITKPQSAFFSPSESAMRSNQDEEEIVSETLARLYAEQGNIQKAIHIYQKLSLLNQEKSRYFAAQIEKLES